MLEELNYKEFLESEEADVAFDNFLEDCDFENYYLDPQFEKIEDSQEMD